MQVNDARVLRGAAIPTALAGVLAVIIGSLVSGVKGGIGAAAATVVVMVFFGLGLFALQRLSHKHPELMMGVGLITYMTQLLLLGVVLAVFKNTDLFDTKVFGLTILGTALVWIVAMGRGYLKAKTLYVEPEKSGDSASDGQDHKQTGAH
ncbi:hypothetical protein AB0M28_03855 [Streptomyces sp. NPDC051940]|uniref:hypothetical protein n=1 Tax=Streptomyces sp. NPDC051940 TaxID=3155675 RepID=UPI003428A959